MANHLTVVLAENSNMIYKTMFSAYGNSVLGTIALIWMLF